MEPLGNEWANYVSGNGLNLGNYLSADTSASAAHPVPFSSHQARPRRAAETELPRTGKGINYQEQRRQRILLSAASAPRQCASTRLLVRLADTPRRRDCWVRVPRSANQDRDDQLCQERKRARPRPARCGVRVSPARRGARTPWQSRCAAHKSRPPCSGAAAAALRTRAVTGPAPVSLRRPTS